MNRRLSLCVDIGGTHLVAAIIDQDSLQLYNNAKTEVYVDSNADKEIILKQWRKGIEGVLKYLNFELNSVCVSIPGPFDYNKGVCLMDGMHKYQSLLYMDVKAWLAELCQVPVNRIYFFNDAEAFLLGEIYYYNLFDKKVVGLTLGTGLGSAFYNGNTVVDLNYGSAKFIDGIAEDYISTRGLLAFVKQKNDKDYDNVKSIVDDIELGNLSNDVFLYLSARLAGFIQKYIDRLNVDTIILGGSISKSHSFFKAELQEMVSIPIEIATMNELNLFCGMASIINEN